ncbi:hypothetical protein [Methanobacterium spitsbergense]|uniref:Uncharacterized protein n=1 Tax=Methanobacterium spitsbergense TaxID=2874285 RepID=A0A8T5V3F7_9EURY|nr:hypothetical protein [Methanobacterium spitsbergense]MBZ2166195.1 hypothetical protein [Methanobacterium spitsbergense]
MTWALKLKVSTLSCKKVYETGKDGVKAINVNNIDRIIEITQDTSKFDQIVIPFDTMTYFKYETDKHSLI